MEISDDVELNQTEDKYDLLGISHIQLKQLIISEKIEGLAQIVNEEGNLEIGNLGVNIYLEKVNP